MGQCLDKVLGEFEFTSTTSLHGGHLNQSKRRISDLMAAADSRPESVPVSLSRGIQKSRHLGGNLA